MNNLDYMTLAYQLAAKGRGTTSPNPMVGALIVRNRQIIAQGYHHHAGGPHAEIVALQNAKKSVRGATLYVTLEPCFHFGRTPPCVDAIIASGIKSVIIGMKDPNPKTNGQSILKLRRAGIQVKVGLLEKELTCLNEAFIKNITTNMPFVVTKTAQTLDGKIAIHNGQSQWITSDKARKLGHELRNEFDGIMVGVNTVLKDNPRLNAAQKSKKIKKIVLDSSLRISLKAKLFVGTTAGQCLVATTDKADRKKMTALTKQGVEILVCPALNGQVDLKWLMKELLYRGIAKILIEGGGQVIGHALKAKLVDKMLVFVAPKLFGDAQALNAVVGLNPRKVNEGIELRDVTVKNIGQDFLFEGYVT